MLKTEIYLNSREWREVARALHDSRRAPAMRRQRSVAAVLTRVATFVLGPKAVDEPDTPRRKVLREFVAATAIRRQPAEEFVPALLSLGLNHLQVEALAMLTVPGRSSRASSAQHRGRTPQPIQMDETGWNLV